MKWSMFTIYKSDHEMELVNGQIIRNNHYYATLPPAPHADRRSLRVLSTRSTLTLTLVAPRPPLSFPAPLPA